MVLNLSISPFGHFKICTYCTLKYGYYILDAIQLFKKNHFVMVPHDKIDRCGPRIQLAYVQYFSYIYIYIYIFILSVTDKNVCYEQAVYLSCF